MLILQFILSLFKKNPWKMISVGICCFLSFYLVKSPDGVLHYENPHPLAIISILVFITLAILLISFTIVGDDTGLGWELSECWISAKLSLVKCEMEDDYYYYHYKGKLLCKSDCQLWPHQIDAFLKRPINLLPDFPGTKSQRRDKKLKELFDEK